MSILDNIGKKIGETAQAAQKKTNELVEITKLNKEISQEEDKIKKTYIELGKKVYDIFSKNGDIDRAYFDGCTAIDEANVRIKELSAKILEKKNIRICPNCGAELGREAAFCVKCGARQEEAMNEPIVEEGFKSCPVCGSKLTLDAVFCPSCGTKQAVAEAEEQQPDFCPSCGNRLEDGVTKCPYCGEEIK